MEMSFLCVNAIISYDISCKFGKVHVFFDNMKNID